VTSPSRVVHRSRQCPTSDRPGRRFSRSRSSRCHGDVSAFPLSNSVSIRTHNLGRSAVSSAWAADIDRPASRTSPGHDRPRLLTHKLYRRPGEGSLAFVMQAPQRLVLSFLATWQIWQLRTCCDGCGHQRVPTTLVAIATGPNASRWLPTAQSKWCEPISSVNAPRRFLRLTTLNGGIRAEARACIPWPQSLAQTSAAPNHDQQQRPRCRGWTRAKRHKMGGGCGAGLRHVPRGIRDGPSLLKGPIADGNFRLGSHVKCWYVPVRSSSNASRGP
jgi:hypothetical protein